MFEGNKINYLALLVLLYTTTLPHLRRKDKFSFLITVAAVMSPARVFKFYHIKVIIVQTATPKGLHLFFFFTLTPFVKAHTHTKIFTLSQTDFHQVKFLIMTSRFSYPSKACTTNGKYRGFLWRFVL